MPLHDLSPDSRGDADFTLVLLHHAGGSAMGFAPFLPHLPGQWRVLGADLPGRLLDRGRARCRTAQEAVARLRDELAAELEGPYAVFGHSMGALLGFELVRALEAEDCGPRRLCVSGSLAPAAYSGAAGPGTRLTPRARRHALGLIEAPGAGARSPLAELVAQTITGDLELVDGYRYTGGPLLHTPLSVFGGSRDPLAPADQLHRWSAHSSRPVTYHVWPGGHFYIFDHAEELCARMVESCRIPAAAATAAVPSQRTAESGRGGGGALPRARSRERS